jgi:hypothetical protein
MNFSKLIGKVPQRAKLTDEGYYVWGASMVRDKSGKCHLFYSRWKKSLGFQSWVTHSEIARAVADEPLGAYRFVDVALPARGDWYWDGHCTHNPTIHRFGDKYYLYYMGNYGDLKIEKDPAELNWLHRNNQRIGVAVSDNPAGGWKRFDKPVIDISGDADAADALCVSNPSITQTPEGTFLLIYKAVAKKRPLPFGGPVSHMAAIAKEPTGEFKKIGGEVFTAQGVDFPAEDPYIWYSRQEGVYYALVKDMNGSFTGAGKSLALFCSSDGTDWKPAMNPLASELKINRVNGEQKVYRLERPQLRLRDGKPDVLFAAVMDLDGDTFNVHIPLV